MIVKDHVDRPQALTLPERLARPRVFIEDPTVAEEAIYTIGIVPSETASDTFTRRETQLLVDCAYVAGSGPANDAAVEILSRLQRVVGQDAAALLAWDPSAGTHVVLGNSAYDAATLVGLGEPYARTDPHQRMLLQQRPLRRDDLPYDYRKTDFYQEVLRPAGFDDGLSSCLFTPDGGYAGMLHLSARSRTAFDPKHTRLISALNASLGQLCDLRRVSPAVLRPIELSRASLIDQHGRQRLVGQYKPATCVEDPNFCRFVERLWGTPWVALSGLWPSRRSWLALRVEPLQDPISRQPSALVLESSCNAPYGLSTRELDILSGVAEGASNQRIASERSISVRTVTTHVERILEKLGQESRAGVAAKATREGLLRLDLMPAARDLLR